MKHFKYKKCFCLFKEMLKISISIRNPVVWQSKSNPAPAAVNPPDFSGRRVRHKREEPVSTRSVQMNPRMEKA